MWVPFSTEQSLSCTYAFRKCKHYCGQAFSLDPSPIETLLIQWAPLTHTRGALFTNSSSINAYLAWAHTVVKEKKEKTRERRRKEERALIFALKTPLSFILLP